MRRGRQARRDLALAAQAVVHRADQLAQVVDAVRGRDVEGAGAGLAPVAQPPGQRALERVRAQRAGVALVEDLERRVQPGGHGVGLQHPHAEAVDRRDPRRLGCLREVAAAELDEPRAHALAQLARGLLRERDREDRGGIDPVVDA